MNSTPGDSPFPLGNISTIDRSAQNTGKMIDFARRSLCLIWRVEMEMEMEMKREEEEEKNV